MTRAKNQSNSLGMQGSTRPHSDRTVHPSKGGC